LSNRRKEACCLISSKKVLHEFGNINGDQECIRCDLDHPYRPYDWHLSWKLDGIEMILFAECGLPGEESIARFRDGTPDSGQHKRD